MLDSHVHLWNPQHLRYSWLDDLPTLNRPFLPTDFTTATARADVTKFIFVEAGCESAQSLAEVDWITGLAQTEPRICGIVAHAPLDQGNSVQTELQALATRPLVKGVRRNLQGERDANFCQQPNLIAGVKLLAQHNFTFDVCIRHDQLPDVTRLVQSVPEVTFILDHLGKPNVKERQTEPWAAHLKAFAAYPNVVCKISGLTTEAHWNHWRTDDLKFYFNHALECFGSDRVLFGSDWPVALLATDYQRWLDTVLTIVSSASTTDQINLFQANAQRIYRV